MPAPRKDTPETQAALRHLFAEAGAREAPIVGMELTPGYTLHRHVLRETRHNPHFGRLAVYENPEPVVCVFRRKVRVPGTTEAQDADPLVVALWDTLPESERRRSRLFACCAEHPVRFTKKGAIADKRRHGRAGRHRPPSRKELVAAGLRRDAPVPELDARNDFERMVVEVWSDLTSQQRRTLYAEMRPAGDHHWREWALEGASSPQAYRSRVRTAYRALARALGRRFCPGRYDLPGAGRTGFDYDRFFDEWNLH